MANRYAELRGVRDVLRSMDRLDQILADGRLIDWAGPKIRDAITRRTQQGIDVNERRFTPYSPAYARLKGRRSPVTLAGTATRRGVAPPVMMGLVRHRKVTNTRGDVEVRSGGDPDRKMVAEAHHRGQGSNPKRKWFGVSKPDIKRLDDATVDYLDAQLRGAAVRGAVESTRPNVSGRTAWVNIKNPD